MEKKGILKDVDVYLVADDKCGRVDYTLEKGVDEKTLPENAVKL